MVLASVSKNYSGYRIDDVKRISENGKTIYKVELKNYSKEWKVVFDSQGRVLQKRED